MFQTPRPLDRSAVIVEPTPEAWLPYLEGSEKERLTFIPLVPGNDRNWDAGWCTYAEHLGDSPDIEILCGGMNSKTPSAAAIWRQGNLLHFGFEQQPAELNDNGRALLENSIVYIARFADDRPLAHTPSPFVNPSYPKPLRYLLRVARADDADPTDIAKHFDDSALRHIANMTLADMRRWIDANVDYLCSARTGRITIDDDAIALRAPLGKQAFFDVLLTALGDADQAARAVELLARRVPDGPGATASPKDWRAFVTANRPFLFFLQEGGYQWHLDSLAKSRSVPCTELRGPRRATAAAVPAPSTRR